MSEAHETAAYHRRISAPMGHLTFPSISAQSERAERHRPSHPAYDVGVASSPIRAALIRLRVGRDRFERPIAIVE